MGEENKTMPGRNNGTLRRGGSTGRPRKLVSTVVEDLKAKGVERVSNHNVVEAFELLINLTEADLSAIVADKSQPMLLRVTSKNILSGKGFEIMEKMLDRAQGKPRLGVDHTAQGLPLAIKFELVENKDYGGE